MMVLPSGVVSFARGLIQAASDSACVTSRRLPCSGVVVRRSDMGSQPAVSQPSPNLPATRRPLRRCSEWPLPLRSAIAPVLSTASIGHQATGSCCRGPQCPAPSPSPSAKYSVHPTDPGSSGVPSQSSSATPNPQISLAPRYQPVPLSNRSLISIAPSTRSNTATSSMRPVKNRSLQNHLPEPSHPTNVADAWTGSVSAATADSTVVPTLLPLM